MTTKTRTRATLGPRGDVTHDTDYNRAGLAGFVNARRDRGTPTEGTTAWNSSESPSGPSRSSGSSETTTTTVRRIKIKRIDGVSDRPWLVVLPTSRGASGVDVYWHHTGDEAISFVERQLNARHARDVDAAYRRYVSGLDAHECQLMP